MPPLIREHMHKNLPDFKKLLLPLITVIIFFPAMASYAQNVPSQAAWYRSNPSGMALEYIPSRLAALRHEYSLSVESISSNSNRVPQILRPFFEASFRIELRTLYENGAFLRQQWLFRGADSFVRLNASCGEEIEFIEIRNRDGQIIREIRYEDLSIWEFRFTYNGNFLVNMDAYYSETQDAPPVQAYRDSLFYNRSGSVRNMERIFYGESGPQISRLMFPAPGVYINPMEEGFFQALLYSSQFLMDISLPDDSRVYYTLDTRGRVVREVWTNEDGDVYGEFINTWSSDRLTSVLWISPDDNRLVEYEYNSTGQRNLELNYRWGVLERMVQFMDGREIEDIYYQGRIILRAVWEDGVKISEDRNFSGDSR